MEISVFQWKKSKVEISVFSIIDFPKHHFLHHYPSFDYFDVLVSDILWFIFLNEEFEFENELKFLTPFEVSDD